VAVSEGFGWVVYLGNEGQGRRLLQTTLLQQHFLHLGSTLSEHCVRRKEPLDAWSFLKALDELPDCSFSIVCEGLEWALWTKRRWSWVFH
jgi:hypothetical protein